MRPLLAIWTLALTLVGCATDATVRATASDLPGTYYSGDGLGYNVTVVLRADGTFKSDWQGCLGLYGEARGTWELLGDQIRFHSAAENEALVGYLRQATTVRHAGKLGFARAQDVERDRIDEELVFLRQAPGP